MFLAGWRKPRSFDSFCYAQDDTSSQREWDGMFMVDQVRIEVEWQSFIGNWT